MPRDVTQIAQKVQGKLHTAEPLISPTNETFENQFVRGEENREREEGVQEQKERRCSDQRERRVCFIDKRKTSLKSRVENSIWKRSVFRDDGDFIDCAADVDKDLSAA